MSGPPPLPPNSDLAALHGILTGSLSAIAAGYEKAGAPLPSVGPDAPPFNPAVALDPAVMGPTMAAVGAAWQIIATVEMPMLYMMKQSAGFHISSAINVAVGAHVAEALRDAGPKGLHVNEIAKWSAVDPAKLARILRELASYHIFVETAPEVFANNRMSSILDTGKDKSDLTIEKRVTWHDGTSGIPALIEHTTDEHLRASSRLGETLLDPETSHSGAVDKTALTKAYGMTVWELFAKLPHMSARFNNAMVGGMVMQDPKAVLSFYDWGSLPKDALFVDVGGGMGQQGFTVQSGHSQIKVIVQDTKDMVKDGKEFWKSKAPDAITSGKVEFMEHDFFKPQPIKGADIYFLRAIMHDWSDATAIEILKNVRAAATEKSTILIVDSIVSYLCPATSEEAAAQQAFKYQPILAPPPMLPQFGVAGSLQYLADSQMLTSMNGQERTIGSWKNLVKQAGLEIQNFSGNPMIPMGGCLICKPI